MVKVAGEKAFPDIETVDEGGPDELFGEVGLLEFFLQLIIKSKAPIKTMNILL